MDQHQHPPTNAVPGGWATDARAPWRPYPTNSFLAPSIKAALAGGGSTVTGAPSPGSASGMAVTSSVIDMCLLVPETLYGLIQNHPEVIKDTGFNGQTLLHRAVLSAQPEAVQILLEHGADPNTPNHHAETPLHFACKRGNPLVLHALIAAGGNLAAADNSGKLIVHHSAHGGCVPGLHYLTEVHGVSLRAVDKDGCTPLHITCLHGHIEAANYLLKKERSDLMKQNHAGDTPLHIAARLGHSLLCWKLLEQGSLRLLQQPNNQGYTPVDLVQQHTQVRFRPVRNVIEYYTRQAARQSARGSRGRGMAPSSVEGPGWVWWLLLFMPFILYAIAVSLTCCFENHGGLIMVVCVVAILMFCGQQGHRMKHLSRWPNPIFMGMFGAGFSHTTISYYVKLLPILLERSPLIAYFSLGYAAVMIYMYYKLLTKDPGVVHQSDVKPSGECYTILDVAKGVKPMESFCRSCEIIMPVMTKHCKLCEQCFVDMDHHCLFLYRCVARYNHQLFVRFILVVMGAQLLYEYYCCRLIVAQYVDETGLFGISFHGVFLYEPWIWSLMLTNMASWFWGYTLVYFQLAVVGKGHTSYFQPNFGSTQLSRRQRFLNMVYFVMGRRPYAVDPLMQRLLSDRR